MPNDDPMADWPLGEPAEAGQPNVAEFSVSEISQALKRTLEDAYGHVRVRGELGRVSRPSSGHVYLDLKDDRAVLSGVIWRGVARTLRIQPEQGLEVIVTGRITTFPGQSRYQIVIEQMEPAGRGALMALLEERRKALEAEGLFAPDRKQALPYLPRVIGVVTSPTGAVIRDIMHRLADRFPRRVIVWPVRVQGESCAGEVSAAIRGFNALSPDGAIPRPDVLIVARGGGSIEDLWGFNEEEVVRAVAASDIPVISAVGHETDWTLIDYVADERAPTPTAAAERAVPVRGELLATVADLGARERRALSRLFEERRTRVRSAARGLPRPEDILGLARQRFDTAAGRLGRALKANTQHHRTRWVQATARLTPRTFTSLIERQRERLETRSHRLARGLAVSARQVIVEGRRRLGELDGRGGRAMRRRLDDVGRQLDGQAKLLESLSYRSVLGRGFALVRDGTGRPVRRAGETSPGADLEIEFQDGRVAARIAGPADGAPPDKPARPQPARPRKPAKGPGQGELF